MDDTAVYCREDRVDHTWTQIYARYPKGWWTVWQTQWDLHFRTPRWLSWSSGGFSTRTGIASHTNSMSKVMFLEAKHPTWAVPKHHYACVKRTHKKNPKSYRRMDGPSSESPSTKHYLNQPSVNFFIMSELQGISDTLWVQYGLFTISKVWTSICLSRLVICMMQTQLPQYCSFMGHSHTARRQ